MRTSSSVDCGKSSYRWPTPAKSAGVITATKLSLRFSKAFANLPGLVSHGTMNNLIAGWVWLA